MSTEELHSRLVFAGSRFCNQQKNPIRESGVGIYLRDIPGTAKPVGSDSGLRDDRSGLQALRGQGNMHSVLFPKARYSAVLRMQSLTGRA